VELVSHTVHAKKQVRKLAGWGLTQKDIASFVGCSQSIIIPRFSSFYDLKASGN